MRIIKILSQHRRDFRATYACETCGATQSGSGYDDANFHKNVIPQMVCNQCNAKAPADYRPLTTLYPEGMQL